VGRTELKKITNKRLLEPMMELAWRFKGCMMMMTMMTMMMILEQIVLLLRTIFESGAKPSLRHTNLLNI